MTDKLFEKTQLNKLDVDLSELDDSQLAAVTSEAEKIILRAPAGSGKTKSIINAIANYRAEYLNDRICAITYTRAARAEMESRLQEMGIFDVEVTTIHVWARNLLKDFAVKYDFKVYILEEPRIKVILEQIIKEYLATSRTTLKSINLEICYSFIMGNKNMDVSDRYRRTLVAIENRYIRYKRVNSLYDFTDYPLYLYDILTAYNETIKNIDALFVDEFQDVDETQLKIFEKVEARKKFAVGDAWQSIFVFRGADGEVFEKIPDFTEYKLKYNYRSYQEIIDYAATVYLKLRDELEYKDCYISLVNYKNPSKIVCSRGNGGFVYIVDPYERCTRLHNDKEDRVSVEVALDDLFSRHPMILCRTNKQVAAINKMGYFECSTVHQAKGLEYDNVIVIDTVISDTESLNVAYVALTRAKNRVLVINWAQFEYEIADAIRNGKLK